MDGDGNLGDQRRDNLRDQRLGDQRRDNFGEKKLSGAPRQLL
jgi:hypothetical protein